MNKSAHTQINYNKNNTKKLNLAQINCNIQLTTEKLNQTNKQLLGLFICVCIALCTIVAHNTAQNRPDNFPSYSPDNHHCSNDVYLREANTLLYATSPSNGVRKLKEMQSIDPNHKNQPKASSFFNQPTGSCWKGC